MHLVGFIIRLYDSHSCHHHACIYSFYRCGHLTCDNVINLLDEGRTFSYVEALLPEHTSSQHGIPQHYTEYCVYWTVHHLDS